jgi:hypothetical protein
MQKMLLAAGVASGLFLAVPDALRHGDDTGLLLDLAVGIWIPLHDIFLARDMRMLLVLLFSFAGADTAGGLHLVYQKAFNTA